jgi:hypothetical protein
MKFWPLRVLARVRDSEARAAAVEARRAIVRAQETESAAAEVGARARELRREAGDGEALRGMASRGGGATALDDLARAAARRARADRQARVLVAECGRALERAGAVLAQAGRASAFAAAARGRADALERGAARWTAAVLSAREAVQEMEAEESWMATRPWGQGG